MDDLIKKVLRALHISLSESRETALIQFIMFGIVGASNTILSYAINVAVLLALSPLKLSYDYYIANVTAFILSVAWSFFWNNKYVFTAEEGKKRNIPLALLKTYISYGFTGLLLANLLAYVWVEMLGISKFIAPLLTLVISIPANFLLNKLWAFK